jgi:hypothetical protein
LKKGHFLSKEMSIFGFLKKLFEKIKFVTEMNFYGLMVKNTRPFCDDKFFQNNEKDLGVFFV